MGEVAAAIGAAHAIPVKPEGMSATTWAVIILGLPILGAIIVGLFRVVPVMTKLGNERENSIDEERRRDMDAMRSEVAEARREAREASAAAHRSEMRLACAIPAVTILMAEVRRLDPAAETNAALRQAKELIEAAGAGDLGFGVVVRKLPGVLHDQDEAPPA